MVLVVMFLNPIENSYDQVHQIRTFLIGLKFQMMQEIMGGIIEAVAGKEAGVEDKILDIIVVVDNLVNSQVSQS